MSYIYIKNEDGRAMLIPFIQNKHWVESKWFWCVLPFSRDALLFEDMDFCDGEYMPVVTETMENFLKEESLTLGSLIFNT